MRFGAQQRRPVVERDSMDDQSAPARFFACSFRVFATLADHMDDLAMFGQQTRHVRHVCSDAASGCGRKLAADDQVFHEGRRRGGVSRNSRRTMQDSHRCSEASHCARIQQRRSRLADKGRRTAEFQMEYSLSVSNVRCGERDRSADGSSRSQRSHPRRLHQFTGDQVRLPLRGAKPDEPSPQSKRCFPASRSEARSLSEATSRNLEPRPDSRGCRLAGRGVRITHRRRRYRFRADHVEIGVGGLHRRHHAVGRDGRVGAVDSLQVRKGHES